MRQDQHAIRAVMRLPRPKRTLLAGASGIALAMALTVPRTAFALDECGVANAGDTVTCTPAGNNFPGGIQYTVTDLTVVVQDGVIIDTTGAAGEPGGIVIGGAGNYGDLVIKAGTGAGAGVTITTDEPGGDGVFAMTQDGSVTITSFTTITASGDTADGIHGYSKSEAVTIASTGDITTTGSDGDGIFARGYTSAKISSTGDIATKGDLASGIGGSVVAGQIVAVSKGDISTQGDLAQGIGVFGVAGATVTSTGDITTKGMTSTGIAGNALGGTSSITSTGDISTQGANATGILGSVLAGTVVISSDGDISTQGDNAFGIHADGLVAASVTSIGDISTTGESADGINAYSKDGTVAVISTGDLTADGNGSRGIHATAGTGSASVTSVGDIKTKGGGSDGISGISTGSSVAITSSGDISVAGGSVDGIYAYAFTGQSTVVSTGDITAAGGSASGIHAESANSFVTVTSVGDITSSGGSSVGIYAYAAGAGASAGVTSSGDITVTGANGIYVKSATGYATIISSGDVSVTGFGLYAVGGQSAAVGSTGNIVTKGVDAIAISATSTGGVTVGSVGNVSTDGIGSIGIYANGVDAVQVSSAGKVTTTKDDAMAIFGHSSASTAVLFSSGNVATAGIDAHGIYASGFLGTGVSSQGNVTVLGAGANGIIATSDTSSGVVFSDGNISTAGDGTFGILANGATKAGVFAQGDISAAGDNAFGIFATGAAGDVVVTQAGDIQALGNSSNGIFVSAGGAVQIDLAGDVLGGWGSGEGIFIGAANPSTLNIYSGSVGALSDLAIVSNANKLTITNNGTITGFFNLAGGDDVLANNSPTTWNLRNFADTDGDGIRDTEGVAIADFGGGSDTLDNTGTVRLANVTGATTIDTTGQIAHPAGGNADITQAGFEQGHLTNLELFINSGAITLQDGVAGDLLAITDAASVGAGGGNVFRSNGGSLALDVVLDDGSSQQSDMLVLDNAATGAGGATSIIIAGLGQGAQTVGDGIQIVNVDGTSSSDAFVQGGLAVAGAYQYDLVFQNQAKTDQNWYLQSKFFEGALEYPAIVSGALSTWYSDIGALHERLGERRREVEDGQTAALTTATDVADSTSVRVNESGQGGWLRVIGADMDIEQDGPADFDLNTTRAEAGFDVGLSDLLGGDWLVLGGFAGYGWSSVGFESGADIDFDIATVGAYATYFRGPYYLDALVKLDWLDGSYNSEAVTDDGEVELPVFGLSLETGYRFDLTAGGLYAQPQAQLSYAHSGDDSFKDDSGSKIELDDADSLRGRLGARLGQELTSDSGAAQGNFYLEASVNQEFLGETSAKASGLRLDQELPGTTFEIGGGIDIALPEEGVSFTVDGDYTFGAEADGVAVTGGFRINW